MAFAIIFVVNMESTVNANGVLQENIKTTSVDIKITRKNFYHIFNRITGEMVAESEDISYRYKFSGEIFEFEDYFAAPIYRMGKSGLEAQGYLYYDDEMKNIVIETNKEKIYAANEKFISNVNQ